MSGSGQPGGAWRTRPTAPVSYADYVRAAIAAGGTANGVFAVRIMRGTLDEVVAELGTVRQIVVRHKRLADELNAQWIENYRIQELEQRTQP